MKNHRSLSHVVKSVQMDFKDNFRVLQPGLLGLSD